MVLLDDRSLSLSSLGAAGVISGVVLKNSMEQMGKESKVIGSALFVGGWLTFLYAVIREGIGLNYKTVQAVLSVAAIVGSVFYMKDRMSKKEKIEWYIGILFPLGWLLLAYTVGLGGLDGITDLGMGDVLSMRSILSFSAAGAVLLSMMWALPKQRDNCIVDGPGMPLFTIGWALMVAAISMR